MEARRGRATARPGAAIEESELESVSRDQHASSGRPGATRGVACELTHHRGLLRVLAADHDHASVLKSGCTLAAGDPRQVGESRPDMLDRVEAVDARGGW